jgi:hypothetical protein
MRLNEKLFGEPSTASSENGLAFARFPIVDGGTDSSGEAAIRYDRPEAPIVEFDAWACRR